ncbi:MAG: HAD-IIA family hydrolase [Candidatus Methanofastidiosia archaeon]
MKFSYLIDLDGVVYIGEEPINAAIDFINALIDNDVPLLFLTNNSTKTPTDYRIKLARFGIGVDDSRIVTSAEVTAMHIKNIYPSARAHVVGEKGLISALKKKKIKIVQKDPTHVVVGWDRRFTYEKMKKACLFIRKGADFIATNRDNTFPSLEGIIPGAGAIVSSIEVSSGVSPLVIGKPNTIIFDYAISKLGVEKNSIVMMGDRLDTDIFGANNAGIKSILVTTGVSEGRDANIAMTKPGRVVETLDSFDWRNPFDRH